MKKRGMIIGGALAAAGALIAINTAGLASPAGVVKTLARGAEPNNDQAKTLTGSTAREGDVPAGEPRRTVRVVYPSPYAPQQK